MLNKKVQTFYSFLRKFRSCGFCRISLYQDSEDNDTRCQTRPTTTEAPPSSILIGLPDRAAHTYLERVVDEINDDHSRYNTALIHV